MQMQQTARLEMARRFIETTNSHLFVTGKADRVWIAGNNEKIRALPATYPNVTVLDWEVLGPQCPGDCFYDDDIHLNGAGQQYYTDLVARVLGV